MTDLRNATGQTVHLAVLEGADVVFIAIVRGGPRPSRWRGSAAACPHTRRRSARPSWRSRRRMSSSASPTADWSGARRTRSAEPSALLRELAEIRRSGVATEREECATGRACVASPILGHGGVPIAAISVAGSVDEIVIPTASLRRCAPQP